MGDRNLQDRCGDCGTPLSGLPSSLPADQRPACPECGGYKIAAKVVLSEPVPISEELTARQRVPEDEFAGVVVGRISPKVAKD